MMPKPKPCPFCRSRGGWLKLRNWAGMSKRWHVFCTACGARGPDTSQSDGGVDCATKADAIRAWNDRER